MWKDKISIFVNHRMTESDVSADEASFIREIFQRITASSLRMYNFQTAAITRLPTIHQNV